MSQQAQTDYVWVQRNIDSCNNDFQFECIDIIIELFHKKHNKADFYMCLLQQRTAHWNTIHSILK